MAEETKQAPELTKRLAQLEESLRKARLQLAKARLTRRRPKSDSLEAELLRRGLWEEVMSRFLDGWTLAQVQAWLKREYSIETSRTSLGSVRQKAWGRKLGEEVLAELARLDDFVDPVRMLTVWLRRLDERYVALVKMEEQLGMPLNEAALSIARVAREYLEALLSALEKARVMVPEMDVNVGGKLRVERDEAAQAEIAEMLKAALADQPEVREGAGDRTADSQDLRRVGSST